MGALTTVAQQIVNGVWGLTQGPRASGANKVTTSEELEKVLLSEGKLSLTGVSVSAETAMMVSAVSSAVSLLAESVAQLPLVLYRRRSDGGKDRLTDHSLAPILHAGRPNSWQNVYEFREMMTMHLTLWGNCYAFKQMQQTGLRSGRVTELLPVHPDRVMVEQKDDWSVEYKIALPNGDRLVVPQERMFHIRDRTLDGAEGVSRLKHGRDSIGLALVAERWGAQLFGNSARPAGVLSSDNKLSPEQIKMIAESWKAAHGGANALGTAVLDGGMKWHPLVMNNTDAQFIETRKFQIAEIARIYRIPPHMLGDLDRATFSNIEHQGLEFLKYALMPWLRRWESAVNTQLLNPNGDVFAEFVVEGFLRGDTKSRMESYSIALQNKFMTRNEVRVRENLDPVPGGDEFENPAITPGDSQMEGQDEPSQAT